MSLVPQDKLQNRYQIEAVLNPSPLNPTYSAIDFERNEFVIVKELQIEALDDWKRMELFEREAQTLTHLNHTGVPRLIDYFKNEAGTRLFLVVEKIPGVSLATMLNNGWRPSEGAVIQIARQVLDILEYLHGLNPPVVHRDIKPSNLLRDAEEQIHLVDFGAAQHLLHPEGGRTVVGTFGYMAPEQFAGKAEPASDLYGLGATLIHLLSGRSPSELPQAGHNLQFQEYLSCSPLLIQWLEVMVDPRLTHRFRSAREALAALERAANGQEFSQSERKTNPPPAPKKNQNTLLIAGGALVVLVGGLLALSLVKQRPSPPQEVHHACFSAPLPAVKPESSPEAEALRADFLAKFPQPAWWEDTPAPRLANVEGLNTLWRCKPSRSGPDLEMFKASYQLILDFPSDDNLVVNAISFLKSSDESYPSLLDLQRFAMDKYFYHQAPEGWDKPGRVVANIALDLAQSLNQKNAYAETIERLQRLLSEREKEINDNHLQLITKHLAYALWKSGKKPLALEKLDQALKKYPEGSWQKDLQKLRLQIAES
ncbi:MAG: protein kinase [Candidatus Sericytochromatia bacterium]